MTLNINLNQKSKFFTKAQFIKLLKNGAINQQHIIIDGNTVDHKPVVKLFTTDSSFTWLVSELDPENPDIAFGLVHNGYESELGYFSIKELESVRGKLGLPIERDKYFEATKPLTKYIGDSAF